MAAEDAGFGGALPNAVPGAEGLDNRKRRLVKGPEKFRETPR